MKIIEDSKVQCKRCNCVFTFDKDDVYTDGYYKRTGWWNVEEVTDTFVECPKCGSTKVQLSNESSKHGCLYLVLFQMVQMIYMKNERWYMQFSPISTSWGSPTTSLCFIAFNI